MDIKDGTTKLTFKYELSGTTATAYSVHALILYKQVVELKIFCNCKIISHIIYKKCLVIIVMELVCRKGQQQKLARAYKNNLAITIRLARNEVTGNDELMLTKRQMIN